MVVKISLRMCGLEQCNVYVAMAGVVCLSPNVCKFIKYAVLCTL